MWYIFSNNCPVMAVWLDHLLLGGKAGASRFFRFRAFTRLNTSYKPNG